MLTKKVLNVTIFFRGRNEKTGKPQDLPVQQEKITLYGMPS
jgi:hypothetical protein